MQKHASLLPGLRRSIAAVAILSAFSAPQAGAVTIPMTSGSIHMDNTTPLIFDDVFVTLGGPDFTLTNYFLHDSFFWTSNPNPAFFFGLRARWWSTTVSYRSCPPTISSSMPASRTSRPVRSTSTHRVSPWVRFFSPCRYVERHDPRGQSEWTRDRRSRHHRLGRRSAQYTELQFPDGPHLRLESITYEIAPVPEPATWMLSVRGS